MAMISGLSHGHSPIVRNQILLLRVHFTAFLYRFDSRQMLGLRRPGIHYSQRIAHASRTIPYMHDTRVIITTRRGHGYCIEE